jgi:hypothetical protein
MFSEHDERRSRFEALVSTHLSTGLSARDAWRTAAREMGWPERPPDDLAGCLMCPDLGLCDAERTSVADLPEPVETVAAWRLAHRLAEAVEQLAEPYYELHLDTEPLRRLHASSVSSAANLAAGHRLGYTPDVLLGNIARCRRALDCVEEFLSRLDEAHATRVIPERVHHRLATRGRIVREAIQRRIRTLRSRIQ